ncbi:MAG TPA: AAA family ATPase, partial [Solirubrobacterales bacterium]|nr:AAA family ATPase [Solirubrobacterales bacterium]
MLHYHRHLTQAVERALDATPVVVITGPRQSGKSTLAAEVVGAREARAVTLDDPAQRALAENDPTGLAESSDGLLLIDEFQKAPAVLDAIKSRIDRRRLAGEDASGIYLLTGSANIWASLQVSESLVGRASRIQLWPLSQGELNYGAQPENFLQRLFAADPPHLTDRSPRRSLISRQVTMGGFPILSSLADDEARRRWLADYAQMSMERDARDVVPRARQLDELPDLFRLAAARPCTIVEPTTMAKAI